MMLTNSRVFVGLLFLLMISDLAGCSLLMPAKAYNPTLYTLNTPVGSTKTNANGPSILVLPVQASATLISNKMAYNLQPNQIAYFAKNTWAAAPADLLTPLILQSLSNSQHFSAVAMAPFVGSTNYRLFTQLQTLQQDFTTKPSQLMMVVTAQLVANSSGQLIASQRFVAIVPAPQDSPAGGAFAANAATQIILRQLNQFCVNYTK